MWRAIRRRLAIGVLHAASWFGRRRDHGVLILTLTGELAEDAGESRLLGLLRRPPTDYLAVLTLLRWARTDPQVLGVLLRVDDLRGS